MDINHVLLIGAGVLGAVLTVTLLVLFFVSRKSQKIMQSLLMIMTRPERAKVADAVRVLNIILADEINKIEQSFQTMRDTLGAQIDSATQLKSALTEQNQQLVALADDATKKLAVMSGRLDNTVSGLGEVVASKSWIDVESATDRFATTVSELLAKIDATSEDTTTKVASIEQQIESWLVKGQELSDRLKSEFDTNANQMRGLTDDSN
ncbi:MAG: methyl-accepting chemotaxis protein, partial [Alphaproteobacteria bacterium]|nr:methyl-accepting chemotaxis protein [Alphaproteobacteria bacterium]